MTTLPDLIRERGKLLSLFDLLELMKQFDILTLFRTAVQYGYIDGMHDVTENRLNYALASGEYHALAPEAMLAFCDSFGFVATRDAIERSAKSRAMPDPELDMSREDFCLLSTEEQATRHAQSQILIAARSEDLRAVRRNLQSELSKPMFI